MRFYRGIITLCLLWCSVIVLFPPVLWLSHEKERALDTLLALHDPKFGVFGGFSGQKLVILGDLVQHLR